MRITATTTVASHPHVSVTGSPVAGVNAFVTIRLPLAELCQVPTFVGDVAALVRDLALMTPSFARRVPAARRQFHYDVNGSPSPPRSPRRAPPIEAQKSRLRTHVLLLGSV